MARLNRIAQSQANAEYNPTIRRTRREGGAAVRSIRSMQAPLEQGLDATAARLKHAGLAPRDLQIALQSLANQHGQVASSVALQTGQAQRETQAQLVDLLQAREQSARSSLLSMRQDRADQQADLDAEIAGEKRQMATDIQQKLMEKELGLLGDDDGGNGLTPTQRRDAKADLETGHFYAKNFFQKARDEGDDPRSWDDNVWRELVEATSSAGKVSIPVAQRSVQAIRAHVTGEGAAPAGPPSTPIQALAQVAGYKAGQAAANPLNALAQILQAAGR